MPIPDVNCEPTEAQVKRMNELCHRMQTAIGALQSYAKQNRIRFRETEPKHLRVGVNNALIEVSAMARLLVSKGIITAEEHFDSIIQMLNFEVDSYDIRVKETLGYPCYYRTTED